VHRLDTLTPQVRDRDRIDEACDRGSIQGDASLAQDPAHDGRVAVGVPNQ
jgi:hypothetical protein